MQEAAISIGQEVTISGFLVQSEIGLLGDMVIVVLEHGYLQLL